MIYHDMGFADAGDRGSVDATKKLTNYGDSDIEVDVRQTEVSIKNERGCDRATR